MIGSWVNRILGSCSRSWFKVSDVRVAISLYLTRTCSWLHDKSGIAWVAEVLNRVFDADVNQVS